MRFLPLSVPRCVLRALMSLSPLLLWQGLGAQTCPPNIDFESGTLDGWTCYVGNVANVGGQNVFSLFPSGGPVDNRHTIISAADAGNDPYGGFSMLSPNGSPYCVKLGNDMGGNEAEAIAYTFTIPANRNTYSLTYYYAVVFEDPNHQPYEQPRMEIEITNVSDNKIIDCASFSFIPLGTPLPGFFQSSVMNSTAPIWCKDWTPVSINLDGLAGKTIQLLFRTADCVFRRHFGYAYIDVDSDCSGEFVGASYCPGDSVVTVSAPFGFQSYTWYNSNRTQVLGRNQTLQFRPPPPAGTTVSVELTPYAGFGCKQTLTARLVDNLQVKSDAGRDTVSCNRQAVRIGSVPRPGLIYQWSPAAGLSNAGAANPLAIPDVTTSYVLTTRSPGGGCESRDTVTVTVSTLPTDISLLGKAEYCIGSPDSAILLVPGADTVRWWKDGALIAGATATAYRVTQTGSYYASLADRLGCRVETPKRDINISSVPRVSWQVDRQEQCFVGNRFVFTNSSTNAVGTMQFRWRFGNAGELTSRDAAISFPAPGVYPVTLTVRSNSVCADSLTIPITVHPNAEAVFAAEAACINLPFLPQNQTAIIPGTQMNYRWTFDQAFWSSDREPPERVFQRAGVHTISLSVNTEQCPEPWHTVSRNIRVEAPLPAQRYPTAFALEQAPLTLEAREAGVSVLWEPARWLNNPAIFRPEFRGPSDQEYFITITRASGCVMVDTLLVQTVKTAEIHVPTGFTPNGDGRNDFLRPVLMGIRELRYFRVFNRWGQLVFETRNDKPGWDGRVRGADQATQTFVWMAEGIGYDGSVITRRGTTVLIR